MHPSSSRDAEFNIFEDEGAAAAVQPSPAQVRAHAFCTRLPRRRVTPSYSGSTHVPLAQWTLLSTQTGGCKENSQVRCPPLAQPLRCGSVLTLGQSQAPSQWNTARALPQLLHAQSGLPAFHIFDDSDDQPPLHPDSSAAGKVLVRAPCPAGTCEPQHSRAPD
jgi:hypothetical protein